MVEQADFEDEERELDRLLAKAREITNESGDRAQVATAIRNAAEILAAEKGELEQAQAEFEKWRAIHKYIHARPFRLPNDLLRSDSWRQVVQRFAHLEEPELGDWLALQVEVAHNREQGIPDYRVRRDGPCYLIMLEYVGNRKRTALAILHWAKAQQAED